MLVRLRAGAQHRDATQLAAEVSTLLRRICVSLWPREQVAGLTGEEWLRFLDQAQGGDEFARGAGRLLIQAPYRPGVAGAELDALMDLCERWMTAVQERRRRGGS